MEFSLTIQKEFHKSFSPTHWNIIAHLKTNHNFFVINPKDGRHGKTKINYSNNFHLMTNISRRTWFQTITWNVKLFKRITRIIVQHFQQNRFLTHVKFYSLFKRNVRCIFQWVWSYAKKYLNLESTTENFCHLYFKFYNSFVRCL